MSVLRALLVNDASLAGHHGSALVTQRCVELAAEAGIALSAGWDWDAVEKALSAENDFDLILVNGEGSIHHDSRTASRIAALAEKLADGNRPAYLVNASEEANGAQVLRGLARFRMRFVRDAASEGSLARAGMACEIVPDLTLSWDQAPLAHAKGALYVTDASDQKNAARLLALAQRWGVQAVSLRAMPPWPVRGSRSRRIGFEAKSLASRFAPASAWSLRYGKVLRTRTDLLQVLTQQASGLICGRYHAVCLALRMGLPFTAVEGNIGKVSALLRDIGIDGRITTLDALERETIPPHPAPFSQEERNRIDAFLADSLARGRDMFVRIAADARAASVR